MDKKYFFFDIDGTLTDKKTGEIRPYIKETLASLQENGHFVALATGRAHYKAIDFMNEIGLKNMVCNGGNALVTDGQLLENIPLNRDKAIALCMQAKSLGYGVLIAIDDSCDVYGNNDLFLQQVGPRQEPTRYIIDGSLQYQTIQEFYKIYIAVALQEESFLTLKETLGNLRFVESYLMFQADNKKEGIEKMIGKINGKIDDVVVFGDDYNDLVMFDNRWYSVAMHEGCKELKEKADYIIENNKSDGIYQACVNLGWISK